MLQRYHQREIIILAILHNTSLVHANLPLPAPQHGRGSDIATARRLFAAGLPQLGVIEIMGIISEIALMAFAGGVAVGLLLLLRLALVVLRRGPATPRKQPAKALIVLGSGRYRP